MMASQGPWPHFSVARVEGAVLETLDADRDDATAALGGDEDSFARLVTRHQSAIFQQMWRFSRDRLVQEELVQQVFVEVYRSLGSFKGKAPFLHWMRRIATRVGYRYWKQEGRKRELRAALEQEALNQPHYHADMAPSEAAEQLHGFLARLDPKDRLILTLMYFEDLDGREIAERMGWSATLVRVRAHRARQRLRKLLDQAGVKG
jgi:RNA polymerase sigma-70 factor, ECF subfamily